MKRKLLTLLIVIGGLTMTACQEDATMDELIKDTELNAAMDPDDDDNTGGSPEGS